LSRPKSTRVAVPIEEEEEWNPKLTEITRAKSAIRDL
jgi:hypothetical protein